MLWENIMKTGVYTEKHTINYQGVENENDYINQRFEQLTAGW